MKSAEERATVRGQRGVFLFCVIWLLAALLSAAVGLAEELTVSLPETVKGYTPCEIRIVSPASGEAELKLYDTLKNPWLKRTVQIHKGENVVPWDGLGEYQERLMAGPYHFIVRLTTEDGREMTGYTRFNINGTTQTLVYALPSSEVLYLDHGERWFVECYVSADCIVRMQVQDAKGKTVYTHDESITDDDGMSIHWAGMLDNRKKVAAGEYTVRMWSKLNPGYVCSFPLSIRETAPESPKVDVTGPVMPERGMTDEEIWAIMMKPSVVIAGNGTFRRIDLLSSPKSSSRPVASLRCALQGLEVLDIEGNWAHVRAWNHEDGKEATGYLLLKTLKVSAPGTHYGVLIDKREQTLTVYRDGKPVGTVPVSTGLPVGRDLYRETPAGAFLTDVHTGASFAQDGYRYEYPLRYDGGNYIHGLGYKRQGRVRDYSDNLGQLGSKASHGCTRVSPFLQEGCPINMYWLWIHLPYHTRVIVLDD